MKMIKMLWVLLILLMTGCSNKKEKIARLWRVKEMSVADQVISGEQVSGFIMDLRPDGTYTMKAMSEERGTWKLSTNGDTLWTYDNTSGKPAGTLIKELTDTKLVVEGNSEGAVLKITFEP